MPERNDQETMGNAGQQYAELPTFYRKANSLMLYQLFAALQIKYAGVPGVKIPFRDEQPLARAYLLTRKEMGVYQRHYQSRMPTQDLKEKVMRNMVKGGPSNKLGVFEPIDTGVHKLDIDNKPEGTTVRFRFGRHANQKLRSDRLALGEAIAAVSRVSPAFVLPEEPRTMNVVFIERNAGPAVRAEVIEFVQDHRRIPKVVLDPVFDLEEAGLA